MKALLRGSSWLPFDSGDRFERDAVRHQGAEGALRAADACARAPPGFAGGVVVEEEEGDGAALAEKGWPVFARGLCMRGTLKDLNGDFKINETLAFGDVIVAPGDLVLGDGDGVVVIPKAMVAGAIEASIRREASESEMMETLKTGVTAVELRGWKRRQPA